MMNLILCFVFGMALNGANLKMNDPYFWILVVLYAIKGSI